MGNQSGGRKTDCPKGDSGGRKRRGQKTGKDERLGRMSRGVRSQKWNGSFGHRWKRTINRPATVVTWRARPLAAGKKNTKF